MLIFALTVLIISRLACAKSNFNLGESYPSHSWMNEKKTFRLWWKFLPHSGNSSLDMIEFAMEAKTTGWVGMGISQNGQMPNSDMVIGWVVNGMVFAEDRNTFGVDGRRRVQPKLDRNQNIQIVGGAESGGWTIIKFRRAVSACEREDLKIPEGTARVLFAYSDSNVDGPNVDYHGPGSSQKGGRSLNLLSTGRPIPSRPADAIGVNIFMDRGKIMKKRTTYYCQLVRLPKVATKHHIVEVIPWIMPNNSAIVHHIALFACPATSHQTFTQASMHAHECNTHNMPDVNGCLGGEVIAAWAVGGEPLIFPSHTGLPFGGDSSATALQWVLLQNHFDNPDLLEGAYDGSGFTVYYTPKLRQYDASVLVVGVEISKRTHFIPPRYPGRALNTAFVTSKCSTAALKANNVNSVTVFASLLHAHWTARSLKLRHIRNGVELPPLDDNPAYDFDYQQSVMLHKYPEIRAGDELIMECWHETSMRSSMTYGGLGTDEEMCLVLLYVYPALSWKYAYNGFHKTVYNRIKAANNSFLTVKGDDVISRFDASTSAAKTFYDDLWLENAERTLNCIGDVNGEFVRFTQEQENGTDSPVFYPRIVTPYVEPANNETCFVPPPPSDKVTPTTESVKPGLSGLRDGCDEYCIFTLIVVVCILGVGGLGCIAYAIWKGRAPKAIFESVPSVTVKSDEFDETNRLQPDA